MFKPWSGLRRSVRHVAAPEHWDRNLFRSPFQLQATHADFESGVSDAQAHLVPPERQPPDLGDMRAHDVALSHLNARGFIQFHPLLAQRLIDFKAAIFLGHALYWSKHLEQVQPHRKGWFFMSAAQWTRATSLSAREQASVRTALVKRGLLLEALAGRPAVMHYKVDLDATAQLLGLPAMTWHDMTDLFRSAIRFYKPLADICGNVGAGLYLSYLLHRQSYALRNPSQDNSTVEMFPGEFVYRPEQARIALCLGVKAQRNAREKLKAAGFIREGRSSLEVVATRVNLMAIASCLQAQGEKTIRKSAPRRHPASGPASTFSVVPAHGANPKSNAASLKRAGDAAPQRQLTLFSPLGLISHWRPNAGMAADNHLSPQDDAANLNNKSGTGSTAAGLVMSLFAPGRVEKIQPTEVTAKLSTGSVTRGNTDALLSMPICPFVGPNLPFCRNYKEQGISRYFQTTTTARSPVDNFTDEKTSRRRVENLENRERPNSETAVEQKNAANGLEWASERAKQVSQWGDSVAGKKSLKTPGIKQEAIRPKPPSAPSQAMAPDLGLILPVGLDAPTKQAILGTITQASPDLRQSFLDELAGHLSIPTKTIHNPAGWLHSLIRRHREGFVALAMAEQVAGLRVKRQQHDARMAGIASGPVDAKAAAATTSQKPVSGEADLDGPSESKRINLQRLEELKASFAAKAKTRGWK